MRVLCEEELDCFVSEVEEEEKKEKKKAMVVRRCAWLRNKALPSAQAEPSAVGKRNNTKYMACVSDLDTT